MSIVLKLMIGGSLITFVMVSVWLLQIFRELTAACDSTKASDERCVCGRAFCPLGPDAFVRTEPVAGFIHGTVAMKSEPALLIPKFDTGHLGQ
jgi:hypothetical protein